MAAGNRHIGYKELLNQLEDRSPGSKASFLFGFLERGQPRFAADAAEERDGLNPCQVCGAPTPGEVCAFCRPVTFNDQHAVEVVACECPEHVGSLLRRQIMTQQPLFVQIRNQVTLIVTPSRLNLPRQICQFESYDASRAQQFKFRGK